MDYELISREEFNNSFKNMLRDFYVYQFKENTTDFKTNTTEAMQNARSKDKKSETEGKKAKICYDMPLPPATFSNYKDRLRNILCREAHIEWGKAARVEHVTADASSVMYNPFYKLYKNCLETTHKEPGSKFSLIAAVLFYLSPTTELINRLSQDEIGELRGRIENILKFSACSADFEKNHRAYTPAFEDVSLKIKNEELERYLKNPPKGGSDEIYTLARNGMTVKFNDVGELIAVRHKGGFCTRNDLFVLLNSFSANGKSEYSADTFNAILDEMEDMGFIVCRNGSYSLSSVTVDALQKCGADGDFGERLNEFLLFASNTLPLGVLGASLLDRLSVKEGIIYHKHNYLVHALNEYNMIDLLNVITVNKGRAPEDMLWVRMECRDADVRRLVHEEIICIPLVIRESTRTGRQSLVYYHLNGSLASVRLDFIDKIHIGKVSRRPKCFLEDFAEDGKKVKRLLDYTYGVSFRGFGSGNVSGFEKPHTVEALLDINDKKADVIIGRVEREMPSHTVYEVCCDERYGRYIRLTVETASVSDVIEWIKSFTCRIIRVTSDGIESPCGIECSRLLDMYDGRESFKDGYLFDRAAFVNTHIDGEAVGKNGREPASAHKYIFNEYFSKELASLIELTLSAVGSELTEDTVTVLADKLASRGRDDEENLTLRKVKESRKQQAENYIRAFFGNPLGFICNGAVTLPLSRAESAWLRQALDSEYAGCFFDRDEIAGMKDVLKTSDLAFDISAVENYDRYRGDAELCRTEEYRNSFRTVFKAVKQKLGLDILYGKGGVKRCIPVRLEYSKRDNMFRVFVVDSENPAVVSGYRFDRIKGVCENCDIRLPEVLDIKPKKQKAVILFDDRADVDSLLNEFAFCEKRCEKSENKTYKLTLYYDSSELYDIAIRLLSYGDDICVTEGRALIKEIKDRLERQIELERKRFI